MIEDIASIEKNEVNKFSYLVAKLLNTVNELFIAAVIAVMISIGALAVTTFAVIVLGFFFWLILLLISLLIVWGVIEIFSASDNLVEKHGFESINQKVNKFFDFILIPK